MAQYTAYANYVIWFSDLAEYNAAVATCGGHGYGHGPFQASNDFGLTWPPPGGAIVGAKGMFTCSYSIGLGAGQQIYHPNASGVFLSSFVDSVIVPGQAPSMGGALGPDCLLIWWGNIVYQPTGDTTTTPPTTPIPARRWIHGFEWSGNNCEGGSGIGNGWSRDASRTADGTGLSIHSASAYAITQYNDEFLVGLTTRDSWERFYIRVKEFGTIDIKIWKSIGSISAGAGAELRLNFTTHVFDVWTEAAGVGTTFRASCTTVFQANKWYLVDVLVRYSSAAPDYGQVRVFINHNLEVDYVDTTGAALDQVQFHAGSKLGAITAGDNVWRIDLDDWISADIPNLGGVEALNSLDWQVGSHVRKAGNVSSVLTNYAGAAESFSQEHSPETPPVSSTVTSSTALATIETLTDLDNEPIGAEGLIGRVAALPGVYSLSAALVTSRVGCSVGGGPIQWFSASYETTTRRWFQMIYSPSGQFVPIDFVPYYLEKEKSNNATLNTIYAQNGLVENIGMWGTEDYIGQEDYTNNVNLHNCRYPRIPQAWNVSAGVPTASCFAVGGTYVGTGTEVTVNLPGPPHFLWIRGTTVSALCVKWFGACIGGHASTSDSVVPNYITRAFIDSTGQAQFRVAGSASAVNQLGVTYQYIAFCDPGGRFNLCGAFAMGSLAVSQVNTLWDPLFTPEFGFTSYDYPGPATGSVQPIIKGPGCAGSDGININGNTVDWGTFGTGVYTAGADVAGTNRSQQNYSMWRTTDPDCGDVAVQLFTYTGDGSGSRIIPMPLTTGRWPLFAYVQPHGALAYFRDPSHTGNNSSSASVLTTSTDRIQGGGVDTLLVGTNLNVLGTVYEVFCIMGDSAGWNNGEFWVPNCKSKGTYNPPVYNPSGVGIGGLDFNGTPALLAVKNLSGIYTLVADKTNDTFYTGAAAATVDVKKPDPTFKTGYIGG